MARRTATNRIQQVLDILGIDWHSPRYGRPRVAGDASTILIEDNGAFGRLISPLKANGDIRLEGKLPPALMTCDAYEERRFNFFRDKSWTNHKRLKQKFIQYLGKPHIFENQNYKSSQWRHQAGVIIFNSWTKNTRPLFNRQEHEDIQKSCRIEIYPGWRQPLNDRDMEAINNMNVIGRGSPRGAKSIITWTPSDYDTVYLREPGYDPERLDAIVAYDKEQENLIACPGKLLIIPTTKIKSIRHEINTKGSGAKSLLIAKTTDNIDVIIAEHDAHHGLDLVSRSLSRILDLSIRKTGSLAI